MTIELFRMPGQSESVRVGLGLRLQSEDGALCTVRHTGWQDFGTRCEFTDESWRMLRRTWNKDTRKYRYWAD